MPAIAGLQDKPPQITHNILIIIYFQTQKPLPPRPRPDNLLRFDYTHEAADGEMTHLTEHPPANQVPVPAGPIAPGYSSGDSASSDATGMSSR